MITDKVMTKSFETLKEAGRYRKYLEDAYIK
jgi:hypothetical protein